MIDNNKAELSLDTRITVLEHDLNKIADVLSKLETSFEKLVDISTSLKHIIAIHEMKFEYKDKDNILIKEELTELNKRVDHLEQFRWYVYGVFAIIIFLSPVIYKFVFKI
jgi:hypothetical protein